MSEATAAQPAPEPPTLEERIAAHTDVIAAATDEMARLRRAITAAAASGVPLGEFDVLLSMNGLADFKKVILDDKDLMREAATLRTFEEMRAARQAAAPVPEPAPLRRQRGQHSADRPPLRLASAGVLAAFKPLSTAVRHSWAAATAHPVVAGTIATATIGLAATTAVVAPHASASGGSGPGSVPAPAVGTVSAVPAPSFRSLVVRPVKPGLDARSAVTPPVVPVPVSGPPPAYVPPSGDPPPPQQGQDPQQQAPAAGTLGVDVTAVDLSSGTGQFTLNCAGGDCPWHVVAGGTVSADVRQGTLADGESATITLTVDPAALLLGGSRMVTVWPGGIRIPVSWQAAPVPDVPSPQDSTVPSPNPS